MSAPPAGAAPLEQPLLRTLAIDPQTAQPEACWAWIAFVSDQPQAVQWLPARLDVAAGTDWRERAGDEVANAWQTILERDAPGPGVAPNEPSLYWFDRAVAAALQGISPAEALADAQLKAAAYADCMAAGGVGADWRACARLADPEAPVP